MEYVIVRGVNIEQLVERVNTNLKEGWEPVGGLFGYHGEFFQALIKRRIV